MDSLASTAVIAREASNVWPQKRDRPWSERCAAMSVACVTHTPSTGLEPAPNTIEALIPGNQAVFNRQRRHSTINYVAPLAFEESTNA